MEGLQEERELWVSIANEQHQLKKNDLQLIDALITKAKTLNEPVITFDFEQSKDEKREQWIITHYVAQLFDMIPENCRIVENREFETKYDEFKVIDEVRMNVKTGQHEPRTT